MNIFQDSRDNQDNQFKGQNHQNIEHSHNQYVFPLNTKKLNSNPIRNHKVNRFKEISNEISPQRNNVSVSNSKNIERDEEDENQTELIKKDLLDWFLIDDEIISLNKKMKDLKNQKNTITKRIEYFMENNHIGDINSQGQKLKYCVSETRKAHTKKSLQNTLGLFFNNCDTAQKAYEYIMDNRVKTKSVRLKREVNKHTQK